MGSEMCIRDSNSIVFSLRQSARSGESSRNRILSIIGTVRPRQTLNVSNERLPDMANTYSLRTQYTLGIMYYVAAKFRLNSDQLRQLPLSMFATSTIVRDATRESRTGTSLKSSMSESGKSRHGNTDNSQVGPARAYAAVNTSNRCIFCFSEKTDTHL